MLYSIIISRLFHPFPWVIPFNSSGIRSLSFLANIIWMFILISAVYLFLTMLPTTVIPTCLFPLNSLYLYKAFHITATQISHPSHLLVMLPMPLPGLQREIQGELQ
jgi:hypothetical protein